MSSSFAIVSSRSLLALGLAALAACGIETVDASTRRPPLGASAPPDSAAGPEAVGGFIADQNQGGLATSLQVLGVYAGRLVDVYDLDAATGLRTLQHRDLAIGLDIASDGTNYELRWSQAGQRDVLTVLHPAGSAGYADAFAGLEAGLTPLIDQGLDASTSPPFSDVPRNAALVVRFDDLLAPETIDATTLRTVVADAHGALPFVPYEPRVLGDPNHGGLADMDGDGAAEFYTTRVILDLAVSELDAKSSPHPIALSPLGPPLAMSEAVPSAALRIPTRANAAIGQTYVLSNLSGHAVDFSSNGSNDTSSATEDVVRAYSVAARANAASSASAASNGGYLGNPVAPSLVGVFPLLLRSVRPVGSGQFQVSIDFVGNTCFRIPRPGDAIELAAHTLEVIPGTPPPMSLQGGKRVSRIRTQLIAGNPTTLLAGLPGQLVGPFHAAAGDMPECFVRFNPPAGNPPVRDVSPGASVVLAFSEPLEPSSVTALDSFTITDLFVLNPLLRRMVGSIQPSANGREFTFVPSVPFDHTAGFSEQYRIALDAGKQRIVDLAGNTLSEPWPVVQFVLDPNAPTKLTGAVSLDFNSIDEDGNTAPEVRGQFVRDLASGVLQARPVTRFSAVADYSNLVVGAMTPFSTGTKTPLSPFGSRAELTWRYHDLGLGLTDESAMNLDVEGLSWALNSARMLDQFSEFRMALAHSKFLPDELINSFSLLPQWPFSGVTKVFDDNQLDPVNDPLKVVHPKASGYLIDPVNSFVSSTGTVMMPWPMNRGIPQTQWLRYTWRDTALTAVGGPNGMGVETGVYQSLTGTFQSPLYQFNKVPTIGLPLLMEFRCYPDSGALGLNTFKVNLAVNSSSRPAFRAFTTGGVLINGSHKLVDPDNTPIATGGIAPNGQPDGKALDNVFYEGQADFVVRVSRLHTVWIDTFSFAANFATPVIEPSPANQPAGTQIVLAFRGATGVTSGSGTPPASRDATKYDFYGDPFKVSGTQTPLFTVTFQLSPGGQPDPTWKSDIAQLNSPLFNNGARFVQVRASLIANPDSAAAPDLSAVGLAFEQ